MKRSFFTLLVALFCQFTSANAQQIERIPIDLGTGKILEAKVLLPSHYRSDHQYGVYLLFGGFETAGEILSLISREVPFLLATFDYPYSGPRKFEFPRTFRDAPLLKQALFDTIQGMVELARILSLRKDVDPNQIGIIGASFGAPFALAAAVAAPGFKNLVLVQGFADLRGTTEYRIKQTLEKTKSNWLSGFLASFISFGIMSYLAPPEPQRIAPRLLETQRVLVVQAREDHFIPEKSRQLLWESISLSKAHAQLIELPGGHLQPGAQAQIDQILEQVLHWANRKSSGEKLANE